MFYGQFFISNSMVLVRRDGYQRRLRLLSGKSQVKVRLRSGQKGQVDIFAYKRYPFDAAHRGESNGALSFVVRDQQRQKS